MFTDAGMVDFELKNNVSDNPAGEFFWAWDLETLTNVSVTNNVGRGDMLAAARPAAAPRPHPGASRTPTTSGTPTPS